MWVSIGAVFCWRTVGVSLGVRGSSPSMTGSQRSEPCEDESGQSFGRAPPSVSELSSPTPPVDIMLAPSAYPSHDVGAISMTRIVLTNLVEQGPAAVAPRSCAQPPADPRATALARARSCTHGALAMAAGLRLLLAGAVSLALPGRAVGERYGSLAHHLAAVRDGSASRPVCRGCGLGWPSRSADLQLECRLTVCHFVRGP